MPSFLTYVAPLALLLPTPAASPEGEPARMGPEDGAPAQEFRLDLAAPGWAVIEAFTGVPVEHQVRIERRVTIRISPISPAARENMVADFARPLRAPRFIERRMGKCVPLRSVAAVQAVSGGRLVLHLRDQRMVSVSLKKSCRAREFYSGFYVEPNADGMLCIDRDKLQARSGAQCEVSAMRQLVLLADQ